MEEIIELIEFLTDLWTVEYPRQSLNKLYRYEWRKERIFVSDVVSGLPRSIGKAKRYLEKLKEGVEFPPIVVVQKANSYKFRLIDGFHRIWAMRKVGISEAEAIIGTRKK